MIELIAFLGNPGPQYQRNRHNAGFLLAEALPFYPRLGWQKKYKGLYAALEDPAFTVTVRFLKPLTFMNLSGEGVQAAASFFKIPPEHILVVHDELELPLGILSLKRGGGLGGHNGLRSMKASLGSVDFWRLRVGIGRPDSRRPGQGGPPGSGQGIVDWVLSDFSAEESVSLAQTLEKGAELIYAILTQGPEALLPEWSKKAVPLSGQGIPG
jgi:PTH1 family peptidyl-tRNA hydrolase